jgi:carbamoylphosphate synthase large subunit
MKFLIVTIPFDTWENILYKNNHLVCIKDDDINKYNNSEYKLMPIWVDDYIKYNNLDINIFKNNLENIDILENKGKFAKYMLEYYPDNIPMTYYYNFDNVSYNNYNLPISKRYIVKPNRSYGSLGIKIIKHYSQNNFKLKSGLKNKVINKNINNIKDHIIQEFIEHTDYYSGHFLVLNGVIHEKIYFYCDNKNIDEIKIGQCYNYQVLEDLVIDDSIFSNIFNNLNFSGISAIDFIISNNKIIIFEINPRLGGTLINDNKYLNLFLDKLINILT